MRIDEMNINNRKTEFIDIDQFFDEMELTDIQKKDRKKLAEDVSDAVLFLFELISQFTEKTISYNFVLSEFKKRFSKEVEKTVVIDDVISSHVDNMAVSIVSTCFKELDEYMNQEEKPNEEDDDDDDPDEKKRKKSVSIGENEACSILNYADFKKAIKQGMTRKQWLTMKDYKVRPSHFAVDDLIIPINDYFFVGGSMLLYPSDIDGDASEVINCRCSIKYLQ